jgi:hypothetical protein
MQAATLDRSATSRCDFSPPDLRGSAGLRGPPFLAARQQPRVTKIAASRALLLIILANRRADFRLGEIAVAERSAVEHQALALRLKVLQVGYEAIYDPGGRSGDVSGRAIHLLDCTTRLSVLREVMSERSHRIIIFAPFTGSLLGTQEFRRHPHK